MSPLLVGSAAWLCAVLAFLPWSVAGTYRTAGDTRPWGTDVLVERVRRRSAAVVLCIVLGVVGRSPLLVSTAPATIWLASSRLRRRRAVRAVSVRNAAVPVMLDSAVQRLQSGSSFSRSVVDALRDDPVLGMLPEVESAISGIDGGGSVVDELTAMARRKDESDVGEWVPQLAATAAVLLSAGGQGSTALDRLSSTVRTNNQAQAEAAAQSGQATASAAVLGVLPLVFAALLGLVNQDARYLYVSTWVGAACLGIAVCLTSLCWALFDRVLVGGPSK